MVNAKQLRTLDTVVTSISTTSHITSYDVGSITLAETVIPVSTGELKCFFGTAIDSEHNKNSVYVLYRYTRAARAKHGKQAYSRILLPCVINDTYFLPIHKL